ncbi:MAG: tRNA (N6-threonylcarbamoyladenosine(37)-N6)-methyltransferase TrmO [Bdellovibrionales bacterium]|nr:tRNA (N6-threonylcarbamoyladenosine(37)-N6)-methyltransferase TrmO [Bdellovibrionales bacterium]
MQLKPIGYVESVYKQKFGVPRQSLLVDEAKAVLHLDRKIVTAQALEGIEEFSHIWLIFGFHLNNNLSLNAKVSPPRLAGGRVGVYASRSPHRFNSLGLSCVKLESVDYPKLNLAGVDLVDSTPVYDIKPYIKEYDAVESAQSGWLERVGKYEDCSVEFSEQAHDLLSAEQMKLILNTLKADPRPINYKKPEFNKIYQMLMDGFDIHFQFIQPKKIFVHKIIVL